MRLIGGLFKVLLGLALVAVAIVLEILWLGFCFGTIIVGIVLLLWFTEILFLPFALLFRPGCQFIAIGKDDLFTLSFPATARRIDPIIRPQVEAIETCGFRSPLDEKVLAYVAALSIAVRQNTRMSLANAINITTTFFPGHQYELSVQNLPHCVNHKDNLREFWGLVAAMVPLAQEELANGHGRFLTDHATAYYRERGVDSRLLGFQPNENG
jgi:hypothetical protein